MHRFFRLLVLSAPLAGVGALPAGASAAWTAPKPITEPGYPGLYSGAAAADGSAVVLVTTRGLGAAVKLPGEEFGSVQELGSAKTQDEQSGPKISITPDGRALAVWATQHHVHAALRQPGARTFDSLGSIRAYPDEPSIDAVASVAGAVGPDGHVYLTWSAVDTAHLAVRAPGASAFTEVASVKSPGGSTSYPPRAVLAASGGGETVGMLAVGAGSGRNELTFTRWNAATGAATQTLEASETTNDGQVERYGGIEALYATSGERANFIWSTTTISRELKVGGVASVSDEFRQLELPGSGPITRPVLPVSFDYSDPAGPMSSALSSESGGGGSALAIVPRRMPGESDHRLLISRRTDAAAPFGAAINPIGTTLLDTEFVSLAPRGGGRYVAGFNTGDQPHHTEIGADGAASALQELPREWPEQIRTAPLALGAGNGDVLLAWYAEVRHSEDDRLHVTYDDVTAPSISAAPTKLTPDAGAAVIDFSATAADRWTPTTVAWDFGDGATAAGAQASHRFTGTGPVRVTATATDAGGNRTSVELRASSPEALREQIGKPVSSAAGTPAQASKPAASVTKAKLARTSFKATAGKVRGKRGTTLRLTLSEASKLELRVSRLVGGRRSGKRCVTGAKAKRTAKRCTARKAAGTLSHEAVAGANRIPFSGKVGRKLLLPGRYEVRVVPVSASGARGKATTLRFRVTR